MKYFSHRLRLHSLVCVGPGRYPKDKFSRDVPQTIYRGYSNFLLNMAFISPSEVENIYIS